MSKLRQGKLMRIVGNREKRISFLSIAASILIIYMLSLPCPILYITGIPCPGCGMTRACMHLVQLDFQGAFHYHPLCFVLPFFILIFLFQQRMSRKAYNICIIIIIAIFFVTYFLRLFNPLDSIVKINLRNGFIYRMLSGF